MYMYKLCREVFACDSPAILSSILSFIYPSIIPLCTKLKEREIDEKIKWAKSITPHAISMQKRPGAVFALLA